MFEPPRMWSFRTYGGTEFTHFAGVHELNNDNQLHRRHNESDGVSNHQRLDGLLNRLFRRRSKKASTFRVTGLWEGNPPVTGEFFHKVPVMRKMFSFAKWRHHATTKRKRCAYFLMVYNTYLSNTLGLNWRLRKWQRCFSFYNYVIIIYCAIMEHVTGKSLSRVPFYEHGLTLMPVWISNYNHYKVWDEIWSLGMDT